MDTIAPATQRQIDFMRSLAHERVTGLTAEQIDAHIESVVAEGKSRVSLAITRLLSMPRPTREREEVATSNLYAGQCARCGGWVFEGMGFIYECPETSTSRAWELRHSDCDADVIPEGGYAVPNDDGVLTFYRMEKRGLYVQASDNLHPLYPTAQAGVARKILSDRDGALRAYGQNLGRCGRCFRALTDETSRVLGLGPVCATR